MKIKLKKSKIGSNKRILGTLDALKLRRLGKIVEVNEKDPAIMGMCYKISHLIEVLDGGVIYKPKKEKKGIKATVKKVVEKKTRTEKVATTKKAPAKKVTKTGTKKAPAKKKTVKQSVEEEKN